MPNQTLPEVQTETAYDKPVWLLQDRIEAGTLTPEETRGRSAASALLATRTAPIKRWRTGSTHSNS